MISFGITGIIGSGKSTIAKIFEILGIPIYYSDYNAKLLMLSNLEIKNKLISNFGNQVYINGILNKDLLSKLVFYDKKHREIINSIVHPIVIQDFTKWIKEQEKSGFQIVGIESALLHQTGLTNITNKNIIVKCDRDTLSKRIMLRDKISYEEALNKINIQEKETTDLSFTDYEINNNDEDSLILQCLDIYRHLENLKNNIN